MSEFRISSLGVRNVCYLLSAYYYYYYYYYHHYYYQGAINQKNQNQKGGDNFQISININAITLNCDYKFM